jgi:hypothetical protein
MLADSQYARDPSLGLAPKTARPGAQDDASLYFVCFERATGQQIDVLGQYDIAVNTKLVAPPHAF